MGAGGAWFASCEVGVVFDALLDKIDMDEEGWCTKCGAVGACDGCGKGLLLLICECDGGRLGIGTLLFSMDYRFDLV